MLHTHLPSGVTTIWPTCQMDSVSPHPTDLKRKVLYKFWGFQGGDYSHYSLLGSDSVQSCRWMLSSSSGSKWVGRDSGLHRQTASKMEIQVHGQGRENGDPSRPSPAQSFLVSGPAGYDPSFSVSIFSRLIAHKKLSLTVLLLVCFLMRTSQRTP
jgi:hypothetical protein